MENNLKYRIKRREEMKTVDVIFVSDELVGSTIVSKKEYERLMRQKVKSECEKVSSGKAEEVAPEGGRTPKRRGAKENDVGGKRSKVIDDVELALAALENDDVEKLTYNLPSTLFDEGDVSAKEIVASQNKTPKSQKKWKNVGEEHSTPNNKRKEIKDIEEIQKILENSDGDFSGSDSDEDYTEESESESESENESDSISSAKCGLRTKKSVANDTSKPLKSSKFTTEKLNDLLKNFQISSEHKNSVETLLKGTFTLFSKWDFLLSQNYNIILYGAGSKREILGKFVERFADVHPVIVVNGFFPAVSVSDILDKVCTVLNIESQEGGDVIERIKACLSNHDLTLYIAVNNIDGAMLRSDKAQTTLSRLAKLRQIHVIASIDHVYAPLIWNKTSYGNFNWVWYDITNFLSYSEETLYEGNLLLQSSGKVTLSSLRNVFNSLTKNGRGVFMIILKHQLQAGEKRGMSFGELYHQCRRDLLINSDVGLRSQLKEFIDHVILKEKRSAEGEELFVISIENSILKQFLEEKETDEN